jgi:DNA repair protein RadA/Sms
VPKLSVQYICEACGAIQMKWVGRCPNCGKWDSLQEEVVEAGAQAKAETRRAVAASASKPLRLEEIKSASVTRLATGVAELDRVLGGGLVPGSLVLLSGDPGIGKSTLLLQACRHIAAAGAKVLYATGEESVEQVGLRAKRLGPFKGDFLLLAETRWENVVAAVDAEKPSLLVIDSIQTLASDDLPSAAGSVSQVRECAARLMALAKPRGLSCLIIGHVTKDGSLAGPRTLEHLVDTVLSFEGEKHSPLRLVRAVKNRFGSTLELGVFEMAEQGLREVANPSEYFLRNRLEGMSGSAAFVSLEGSRPLIAELQALVSPTHWGTPQRNSSGLDPYRLNLLYAVMEKRCGVNLYNQDIFVSVAGGLRLEEPGVDLAVAAAVASSLRNKAIPKNWVLFAEVGLGGELRAAPQAELRLREAARLGFSDALIAREDPKSMERLAKLGLKLRPARTLEEALKDLENG